jgi:hypothetical protein
MYFAKIEVKRLRNSKMNGVFTTVSLQNELGVVRASFVITTNCSHNAFPTGFFHASAVSCAT